MDQSMKVSMLYEQIRRLNTQVDVFKMLDKNDLMKIKIEEWRENLITATDKLKGETELLFLGEFSTGKSTFINALVGEDVLPTASQPCTAIITEIRFVDDQAGHRCLIHYINKTTGAEISIPEMQNTVNSAKSTADISAIHHIEVIYDISQKGTSDDLTGLRVLKEANIRLIDTPGLNAPYGVNMDIVEDYVQRSTAVFWFFDSQRIGGSLTENVINRLKKYTRSITPVVAKADLINDPDEKEEISNRIIRLYPGLSLPAYVSAFKFKEANRAITKNQSENLPELGELTLKLIAESGVQELSNKVVYMGEKEKNENVRIKACVGILKIVAEQMQKLSNSEHTKASAYLRGKGFNVESKENIELLELHKHLRETAEKEAEKISKSFSDQVGESTIKAIHSGKSSKDMSRIIKDEMQTIMDEKIYIETDKSIERFLNEFKKYNDKLRWELGDITSNRKIALPEVPSFNSMQQELHKVVGILGDTVKHMGFTSVATGGVGVFLTTTATSIAGMTAGPFGMIHIGAILSPIIGIAGPALLAIALIPLVPEMIDSSRKRDEQNDSLIRSRIKILVYELRIDNQIKEMYNKITDELLEKTLMSMNQGAKGTFTLMADYADITSEVKGVSEIIQYNF